VAKVHLLAYESPAAANQRYLVNAQSFSYQLFCDMIRAHFPELAATTPEGNSNKPLPDVYKLDNSKVVKELDSLWRPVEEILFETVSSLRNLEKSLG
jgi:nucleoside-diphosphate-sugar epimerase